MAEPNEPGGQPPRAPQPPHYYTGPGGQLAPLPTVPPPEPEKTRRVGSVTMAIGLILLGFIMLLRVFVPQIDLSLLLRLSPIILVFLGVEILLSNLLAKGKRLKYDFLSVFFSLLLIGGSLLGAAVPEFIHWGIESKEVNSRLTGELNAAVQEALDDTGSFTAPSVDSYVDIDRSSFSSDMELGDIGSGHYVQLRLYLGTEYPGPQAFAEACHQAAQAILTVVPQVNYASFYSTTRSPSPIEGDVQYTLYTDNTHQFTSSAGQLAALVATQRWAGDEMGYISASEYGSGE